MALLPPMGQLLDQSICAPSERNYLGTELNTRQGWAGAVQTRRGRVSLSVRSPSLVSAGSRQGQFWSVAPARSMGWDSRGWSIEELHREV